MQLTVAYHRNGDVHTTETGGVALGNIVIDNTNVPADQRGGLLFLSEWCEAVGKLCRFRRWF